MARLAAALWIAWAIVVWNVVFDHVIVVAGREYVTAATLAARGPGPYARMDDWMRPAIAHGLWLATAASALILIIGFVAIRRAAAMGNPVTNPAEAGSHVRRGEHAQIGESAQTDERVQTGERVRTGESEGVA